MTVQPLTPSRAARRQLLIDRWTEKLTRAGHGEHAEARARDLLADMDDLGFALPPGIEDAPPARPDRAELDGPGHRAFLEAKAELAARRTQPDQPK